MNDAEKKRDKILENVAERGSSLVNQKSHRQLAPRKLGLCATCKHLAYYKTRLMEEAYWCTKFEGKRLNTTDSIEHCTKYWNASWENIWDLKELATLIDSPKRKLGFGNNE